jgi:hypothetical protein
MSCDHRHWGVRDYSQAGRKEAESTVGLTTASGETIPVVKEVSVELNLGRHTLRIWGFMANITDEFILGLDVLQDYDASVDVGHHVLQLGLEEVPVTEAPKVLALTKSRPRAAGTCGRCDGNAEEPVIS